MADIVYNTKLTPSIQTNKPTKSLVKNKLKIKNNNNKSKYKKSYFNLLLNFVFMKKIKIKKTNKTVNCEKKTLELKTNSVPFENAIKSLL